ncbi:MAG: type II toxin-antitoxin system ParD family antitoxin [Acetobacteraceae bacterium]|jgi:antitoxin ParD1/3/4
MPSRASLNVSLTPELTTYVAALVATGRYRSASEVLRAALRLLQREEPAKAVSSRRDTGGTGRRSVQGRN